MAEQTSTDALKTQLANKIFTKPPTVLFEGDKPSDSPDYVSHIADTLLKAADAGPGKLDAALEKIAAYEDAQSKKKPPVKTGSDITYTVKDDKDPTKTKEVTTHFSDTQIAQFVAQRSGNYARFMKKAPEVKDIKQAVNDAFNLLPELAQNGVVKAGNTTFKLEGASTGNIADAYDVEVRSMNSKHNDAASGPIPEKFVTKPENQPKPFTKNADEKAKEKHTDGKAASASGPDFAALTDAAMKIPSSELAYGAGASSSIPTLVASKPRSL